MLLNLPTNQHLNQNINQNRAPSSGRRKRTTLDNDIDQKLLDFVINKSYTKRMAGHGHVDAQEITNSVTNFLLTFIPEEEAEQEL